MPVLRRVDTREGKGEQRQLIAGTIASPPGTGSSSGQSSVKPRCTSTTRRDVERGEKLDMKAM